ncbi:ParA family protein [Aliikangiella coralliicola]|uniref:ParA family protein n=1 Tax=Aliikangiella coralliicola TaxID=2592383 RepID=A0A545U610_9GAMM|nr:ParA family protein [Aliikangiella coralliicola]TQV84910.1 ParA family protein [Aliikangiella coralliicola]
MTAKIISVAQAKGGVGKSTMCANLAVTFSQSSKVLMVDCDPPQHSLSAWFKVRSDLYEDTGLVLEQAATPAQLNSLIDKSKETYDYILIDGAPHVNATVRAMMLVSNLVLVPLAPSSVEIWSFNTFEELIHKAEKFNKSMKTKICWNRVRRRVRSSEEVISSVAKDSKLTALKNQLTFRVAYMDSFAEGCSVYEWTDPVASAEVWSLSSAIKRVVNKLEPVNPSKSAAALEFVKKG